MRDEALQHAARDDGGGAADQLAAGACPRGRSPRQLLYEGLQADGSDFPLRISGLAGSTATAGGRPSTRDLVAELPHHIFGTRISYLPRQIAETAVCEEVRPP